MAIQDWQTAASKGKEIQEKSINSEWLLPSSKLPSKDRLNVVDVPKESGLLTAKELEITETDAVNLVKKMAAGEWSAEEVVISFLKRATIGQQLVSHTIHSICTNM
jgi:amidase